MTSELSERLARAPFLILDGGLATSLEARGCDLDDPLWSAKMLIEAPEQVRSVHRSFAEAGADILTSASYQATIPGLLARGLSEHEARALLRRSVSLAREAASPSDARAPSIAASIGSYGAYLADGSEYRGDYGLTRAALVEFHRPRLDALQAAQPDVLAFETIPSAREAEAIAELLDEREGPPAWISFSIRDEPAGATAGVRISEGVALDEAIAPLRRHPRVLALGVNCLAPARVLPALERLASVAPDLPLIAYPNSGEGWAARAWTGSATEPAHFAALARSWVEAGARIIGGCCRTGPAHIAALAELRDQLVSDELTQR